MVCAFAAPPHSTEKMNYATSCACLCSCHAPPSVISHHITSLQLPPALFSLGLVPSIYRTAGVAFPPGVALRQTVYFQARSMLSLIDVGRSLERRVSCPRGEGKQKKQNRTPTSCQTLWRIFFDSNNRADYSTCNFDQPSRRLENKRPLMGWLMGCSASSLRRPCGSTTAHTLQYSRQR